MHARKVEDGAQEEERAEGSEEGVVPACGQWVSGRSREGGGWREGDRGRGGG